MPDYKVFGKVEKGFEPVYEQFEKNFINGIEDHAQLCVYVDGEVVVDVWGGRNDCTNYNGDTITNIFSSTKCLASICMALLVDKKVLNYADKVINHWPDYGNGNKEKENMSVAQILRHEGGMARFSKSLALTDLQTENIKDNAIGQVIEEEPLVFPPSRTNTQAEYHTLTRGWILNEIFRRADPSQRTMGECLREDICKPLNVDAYIGLPSEKLSDSFGLSGRSIGEVLRRSMVPKKYRRKTEPNFLNMLSLMKVFGAAAKDKPAMEHMGGLTIRDLINQVEHPAVRTGECPSVNGQCSARGLAKIAYVMANKGRDDHIQIMSEDTWEQMHSGSDKACPMYPFPPSVHVNFSLGGINHFKVTGENAPLHMRTSCENRAGYYGWFGFGGSVFQWYPDYKIGFAYVPTLLAWEDMTNARGALLQKIVVECVIKLNR